VRRNLNKYDCRQFLVPFPSLQVPYFSVSFIMSASFLEIIELPSGEIILRRSDEDNAEPLVTMSFSQELLEFLQGDQIEIAKAMLDTCIAEVGRKIEPDAGEYIPDHRVLH